MNGDKLRIFLLVVLIGAVPQKVNLCAQDRLTTINTDSIPQCNCCPFLQLDTNKDTISTAFCAAYKLKVYSFNTVYFENMPANLMIYHHRRNGSKLVAEFRYDRWGKNEWIRHDYHAKSVPYRKQLLKQYLKTKDSIQYNQIEIIDKE